MGLGPLNDVNLAQARAKAAALRKLLLDGNDPFAALVEQRRQHELDAAKSATFEECCTRHIEANRATWKNQKHAAAVAYHTQEIAFPAMGHLPVAEIDTGLVVRVLESIWTTRHVTATRVRGRIESVLDWAKVRGYRVGENPAR